MIVEMSKSQNPSQLEILNFLWSGNIPFLLVGGFYVFSLSLYICRSQHVY